MYSDFEVLFIFIPFTYYLIVTRDIADRIVASRWSVHCAGAPIYKKNNEDNGLGLNVRIGNQREAHPLESR